MIQKDGGTVIQKDGGTVITPEAIATALALWEDADDPEVSYVLQSAIRALNAIAWERFRVKHQTASERRSEAGRRIMFKVRHQSH